MLDDMPELELDPVAARLIAAGVAEVRPLTGGASSLTYAGVMAGRGVVVKVAPPGVPPILNRDVLRQARIIRVLGETPVPVPEVLWEDAGAPPDVPPLFVMSFLEGSSVEPLFDTAVSDAPRNMVARRLRNAARTMAELHRLDPPSLLGDEPVIGPEQEIDRWRRLLQTVDPVLVPGWEPVGEALWSTVPAALPAAIVHGDFRLGNLLAVDERITGVVDWEIWTVGDPRVDVGWFLLNGDPHTYRRLTPYTGSTPPPAELAWTYADALGRELPDLAWFQALASFKSAATWSLIVKHDRRRATPDPDIEAMVPVIPRLLAQARRLLA
jgi:aminoglycoside phosphotransferase (APT) family kinase protein